MKYIKILLVICLSFVLGNNVIYAEDNPNIEFNQMYWGKNYLGRILTNIRRRFKENKIDDPNWNIYS